MLNSRYVLKTLCGEERGRFSQWKHNNLTTLRSAILLFCSLAPQYYVHHNSIVRQSSSSQQHDRTKEERVEQQIQKQTGVVSFGFRAQQNPLIKKVIRVTYNTLSAGSHILWYYYWSVSGRPSSKIFKIINTGRVEGKKDCHITGQGATIGTRPRVEKNNSGSLFWVLISLYLVVS